MHENFFAMILYRNDNSINKKKQKTTKKQNNI